MQYVFQGIGTTQPNLNPHENQLKLYFSKLVQVFSETHPKKSDMTLGKCFLVMVRSAALCVCGIGFGLE